MLGTHRGQSHWQKKNREQQSTQKNMRRKMPMANFDKRLGYVFVVPRLRNFFAIGFPFRPIFMTRAQSSRYRSNWINSFNIHVTLKWISWEIRSRPGTCSLLIMGWNNHGAFISLYLSSAPVVTIREKPFAICISNKNIRAFRHRAGLIFRANLA